MSWKEIHGEKYPALKKSLSWRILEKNLTLLYFREKFHALGVWGNDSHPNQITAIPPPPLKSRMVDP